MAEKRSGKRRRLWLLAPGALLLFVLYFLLGAWLPNLEHRQVSGAFQAWAAEADYTAEQPGNEEVAYLSGNVEAMEYRLAMIEAAEEEIILSTFDFDADTAGKQLLAALLHAAGRGVEVKVLVDGISGWMDLRGNGWFQALAGHENVEIKIYNPINLLLPWQTMYRLHDKYFIVDDRMYLLGGRNSTDLFLGDYSESRNIDSEVFVRRTGVRPGDSLEQLRAYFDQVWSLPECEEYRGGSSARAEGRRTELTELYTQLSGIYPAAFEADYLERADTFPARRISLLSNPVGAENKAPELWCAMTALMEGSGDVLVHTPYVILSREMESDLAGVSESVGAFTLILNDVASGANPWGCVDYLNEKENILATGVTVGEYLGEYSMHTKNVLVDDRLCLVGSFNFDMRSAYLDTELMLVIDSEELNARLRESAREDLEHCRVVSQAGEVLGAQFVPRELGEGKRAGYAVLRRLIRPFRCLL